jgi:hypothetical protein
MQLRLLHFCNMASSLRETSKKWMQVKHGEKKTCLMRVLVFTTFTLESKL